MSGNIRGIFQRINISNYGNARSVNHSINNINSRIIGKLLCRIKLLKIDGRISLLQIRKQLKRAIILIKQLIPANINISYHQKNYTMHIEDHSNKKKITKGLLLVFSTAIISGVSIFINGLFISKVAPNIFTFLKNGLTAFAIFGIIIGLHALTKHKTEIFSLKPIQWAKLALIGLIGGSIPFLLFFNGLAQIGGSAGSMIHKSMFIFVMILAIFALKEKINRWIFPLAILLLIANNLILNVSFESFGTGHALVLGATILWAIENVISKKVLEDLSGSVVAFGRMFFGAIFIFAYLLSTGKAGTITSLSTEQWIVTLVASLFLIGYVLTWYNGLKHVPVTLATAILLLGAPITTLLNLIFLQKTVTLAQGVGIVLTIAAVTGWILITKPKAQTLNVKSPSHRHNHNGS